MTVMSMTSGPPIRVRLPPAMVTRDRAASATRLSMMPSKSTIGSDAGSAIDSSASRGVAPIAARSLRFTASAR